MIANMRYQKRKPYLICIDSDGCVMDTMNVKHINCFGPRLIEEWCLFAYADEILKLWNQLNLFSSTRGINRFQGLSLLFSTIADQGIEIEGREVLAAWCETTPSLSNQALEKAIEHTHNECLNKALSWSIMVNQSIEVLPETDCVFEHAKEAMEILYEKADIAIVSSANKEAVKEEWTRLGCMEYVTILCGQDMGTKSYCIHELKQFYDASQVLMIGDALSDLKAAQENNVSFYPILAGKEAESWKRLKEDVALRFLSGQCTREELHTFIEAMEKNLG